jgi:TM2 domain-containing membrane protein YozV/RNA polymerase subunit RPABC4/transcription elongation factor Spt4
MHCRNCGKQIDDKAAVCIHCGVPPKASTAFCFNCGNTTTPKQALCLNCGVTLATRGTGQKSKSTATLLAMFLGTIGVHKFYMGSWGWGIIYVVLCLTFFLSWIPLITSLVETIKVILMTDDEFAIKALAFKNEGPFGFFW